MLCATSLRILPTGCIIGQKNLFSKNPVIGPPTQELNRRHFALWYRAQPTQVLHISAPLPLMGRIQSGEQIFFCNFTAILPQFYGNLPRLYRNFTAIYSDFTAILRQFIANFSGWGDCNPPPPPALSLFFHKSAQDLKSRPPSPILQCHWLYPPSQCYPSSVVSNGPTPPVPQKWE